MCPGGHGARRPGEVAVEVASAGPARNPRGSRRGIVRVVVGAVRRTAGIAAYVVVVVWAVDEVGARIGRC